MLQSFSMPSIAAFIWSSKTYSFFSCLLTARRAGDHGANNILESLSVFCLGFCFIPPNLEPHCGQGFTDCHCIASWCHDAWSSLLWPQIRQSHQGLVQEGGSMWYLLKPTMIAMGILVCLAFGNQHIDENWHGSQNFGWCKCFRCTSALARLSSMTCLSSFPAPKSNPITLNLLYVLRAAAVPDKNGTWPRWRMTAALEYRRGHLLE